MRGETNKRVATSSSAGTPDRHASAISSVAEMLNDRSLLVRDSRTTRSPLAPGSGLMRSLCTTAYVAVDAHRLDDMKPYLFKTTDYGASWKRLDGGLAKDVYLHAVTTHASSRRTQGVECPDGIGRLTLRPMLEPLAQQDQGDDRGRCFEVQMRHAVLGMLVEEVDREPVGR